MNEVKALKTISVIAMAGVLFSGYLSYGELFKGSCDLTGVSCGANNVGGVPACVYGLVMYIIVLIVSVLGWKGKKVM
ncbi:hypothetical protein KJ909_01880 [Patescibacteria group bacterium]|nr:hypothetical protein [Patescibacteria group bacterium]